MQVGDQLTELFRSEAGALGGHHSASIDDCLFDETVIRGQSARQIFFPVEAHQARPVQTPRRIRIVTHRAALLVYLPPGGLLRIQAQSRVGLFGRIRPAGGHARRKRQTSENECDLFQATIIFGFLPLSIPRFLLLQAGSTAISRVVRIGWDETMPLFAVCLRDAVSDFTIRIEEFNLGFARRRNA